MLTYKYLNLHNFASNFEKCKKNIIIIPLSSFEELHRKSLNKKIKSTQKVLP